MNFPILSAITFIPIIGALFVFLTRSEKDEKILVQYIFQYLPALLIFL